MILQKFLDVLFPAGSWKVIYDYVCDSELFRQPVKDPGQPPESMLYIFMIGFVWLGIFPSMIYCFVKAAKALVKSARTKNNEAPTDERSSAVKKYREESAAGKNAFLVMGTSGSALGSLIASWFISRVCAANASELVDTYVSFAHHFFLLSVIFAVIFISAYLWDSAKKRAYLRALKEAPQEVGGIKRGSD